MYFSVMANYHLTVKMISRTSGKSCVAALAYRTATELQDLRTGETFDYRNKGFVSHVSILIPEDAPLWIQEISEECKTSRQTAIQKISDIFEAAEKRSDSRVYREVEFSLPTELTDAQNIKWAEEFIREVCVKKGMVSISSFHMDFDKTTGQAKPHCHALLSTRNLTAEGLSPVKNLEWDRESLVHELREQCASYQNKALREHGFEAQVSHLSYKDRDIEIEGEPKLGSAIMDMAKRGLKLDKLDNFNAVKLRNQFRILRNPELVFSIITSSHSTFTRHDIARVLNRYIDDAAQFQTLHDRLLGSRNLVPLGVKEGTEQVYTTQEMLKVEMGLVNRAERLSAQHTHKVNSSVIDQVIEQHNQKLSEYGGLSADQDRAIRHMLSSEQIACVVGYAGAGKTTSLEAARESWEASGYTVVGLAPTGKAARNMEDCGIRSMTVHKFLYAQEQGREQISPKSVIVLDEAGMVDSRRFADLLTIIDQAGAKIVPMGDGNQLQAVEAGPALRLLMQRLRLAVLETVVRQKEDWQKDATRLFGLQQADKALALYLEKGSFRIVAEKATSPGMGESVISSSSPESGKATGKQTVDQYCLARQMSGRIWKEMVVDFVKEHGRAFGGQGDFKPLSHHQDYALYKAWEDSRYKAAGEIVNGFEDYKKELEVRGVDIKAMASLVDKRYVAENNKQATSVLKEIDGILRQMSYSHVVDTRQATRDALVDAWMRDRIAMPEQSHLMLAFTRKDTQSLNEGARHLMRQAGVIKGPEFTYETHSIDKDDFGKDLITKQERTFAVGDRLLFTRNHTSLGVKNGSLGTVTSLSQDRISVLLDGSGARDVSFAPRLYPYIDNGWATNIHKSQGITVDHVKKLASYEEYRNLAYVGMSRHRETLEVFGSSLDFWREEKVIDRLSRVQEKLSGYDYVTAEKLEELVRDDARVLWREQKVQEVKDLWNAVKGTARSAVDQWLDRPKDSIKIDPLESFEHSEEKRSGSLFKETGEPIRQPDHSMDTGPVLSDISLSQTLDQGETFESKLQAVQDKINASYEVRTVAREKFLSFEEAEGRLKERMVELATDVLGAPTRRTSHQLRFGKKGSISVFTGGPKAGLYANHEAGVYGGPLKLIEDQLGHASALDSLKWASEWLGGNPVVIDQRVVRKEPDDKQPSVWTPVIPVPGDIKAPDIKTDAYLKSMLKDGARETARYAYRDEAGNLKGYVFRIEKADGSKITPPLAWCQNERGFKAWKWQGFEKDNRTPYGIEKLSGEPGKPVLVVEGEKTADAAQKLLPDYHVLTWSGGAGSVGKTNWDCLAGKDVVIWPDNDAGSIKAAQTLQKILSSVNAEKGLHASAGIISLPDTLPEKWDLADQLPAGWTLDTIKGLLATKGLNKDHASIVINKNTDSGKSYSFQEQAILDYLNQELTTEKNSWLEQSDIERFSRQARDNPVAMLAKWQKITEDYSFNAASTPSKDHAASRPSEKIYATEEEKIRAYLHQEITREKHPWLNDNDCQKYSKAAEENPARMLKIWQGITEDYSFKLTPDESEKTPASEAFSKLDLPQELSEEQKVAIKLQEKEIHAYLCNEVRADKHEWLSHEDASKILEAAKDDPFATLERWKDISGDDSFEPSIPDALMSEEQKNVKYSILAYLREDMKRLGKAGIDEKTQQEILQLAEAHPDKGLQEWQLLTENYEFNPYAARLSMRELKVNEYLKENLAEDETSLRKTIKAQTVALLHSNPLKSYEVWQLHTHDKTFDPKTGIPAIETQAQNLIHSLEASVPGNLLQFWQDQLINHPESVIKQCQDFIQARNEQNMFDKSVRSFIKLSEACDKLAWDDPQLKKMDAELKKITDRYLNDEKFIKEIEGSKSQAATERLADQIREKDMTLSQHIRGRGMEM